MQLRLVDGKDQPVADQPVTIVKKDFAGTETRFETTTDDKGMATQADLPVVTDALYYVGIVYDGAPYTSRFFGLDKRGGVVVAMRVVGLLLVSALMIIPVATAQLVTRSFRATGMVASALGTVVSVLGVGTSYYVDTPSGGTIVLLAIAVFVLVAVGAAMRERLSS